MTMSQFSSRESIWCGFGWRKIKASGVVYVLGCPLVFKCGSTAVEVCFVLKGIQSHVWTFCELILMCFLIDTLIC